MKTPVAAIPVLIAAAFAVQCKADYLFTYQDRTGDIVGFTEPTLQPSGNVTSFLFDKNSVTNLIFQGNAPANCGLIASQTNGCTQAANATVVVTSAFANGSFTAPGVFDGANGVTVDILQYSGYLFTYQDTNGNILAFSEPTLQPSGGASQFLFSTPGITSFTFNNDTTSCGILGSRNPIGCTGVNNAFNEAFLFPAGSFASTGTFSGSLATVNIVQATATPEPATAALIPLALLAGIIYFQRSRNSPKELSLRPASAPSAPPR